MITPDILCVQPLHLDFPLFRYNMVKYKDYFRSLTIVLSNHYQEKDYSNFIRVHLPFANFIEYKGDKPDWRNGAVNAGLDAMPKDGYVLFLEQDFLFTKGFLDKVLEHPSLSLYFKEGERKHPAFALVKRILVDETSKDFSAYPDTYGDHFSKFFNELVIGNNINNLRVKNTVDYYHLNGLSQNYMNYKLNEPFYRGEQFLVYNSLCRYLPIEHHPEFYQTELAIRMKYGKGDEKGFIKNFFPENEHIS